MKKLTLLFAFFLVAGLTSVQAQSEKSCSKKCTKAEMKACTGEKASMTKTDVSEAAAVAASMDETIEQKVCDVSGHVSYTKKNVCEKSGKVSFASVEYDAATGQFVSMEEVVEATAKGEKAKASCTPKSADGKACCSKGKSAKAEVVAPAKKEKAKKGA